MAKNDEVTNALDLNHQEEATGHSLQATRCSTQWTRPVKQT